VVPHSHILAIATPSPIPARVLGSSQREAYHGCAAHPLPHSPLGIADRALASWVGIYAIRGFDVEVGASRFGCGSGARAALQRTVREASASTSFTAGSTEVHAMADPEGYTYLFAAYELVWWVTGPEEVARQVLAGLLNTPELVMPRSPS
jgi:hypothetical protein